MSHRSLDYQPLPSIHYRGRTLTRGGRPLNDPTFAQSSWSGNGNATAGKAPRFKPSTLDHDGGATGRRSGSSRPVRSGGSRSRPSTLRTGMIKGAGWLDFLERVGERGAYRSGFALQLVLGFCAFCVAFFVVFEPLTADLIWQDQCVSATCGMLGWMGLQPDICIFNDPSPKIEVFSLPDSLSGQIREATRIQDEFASLLVNDSNFRVIPMRDALRDGSNWCWSDRTIPGALATEYTSNIEDFRQQELSSEKGFEKVDSNMLLSLEAVRRVVRKAIRSMKTAIEIENNQQSIFGHLRKYSMFAHPEPPRLCWKYIDNLHNVISGHLEVLDDILEDLEKQLGSNEQLLEFRVRTMNMKGIDMNRWKLADFEFRSKNISDSVTMTKSMVAQLREAEKKVTCMKDRMEGLNANPKISENITWSKAELQDMLRLLENSDKFLDALSWISYIF